ncbi:MULTISPECIES: stage II sporulation protein R [Clostridium]|uniref:Stage II sporulation protein R n=1 Tax=Clostridium faecium TaxID=2762223 RepID=A0ABR8YT17_9CLOT|nr:MULTISPECIES: stage II sporulation protein R [Clostridium]MBD8047111.1 stage II sporulation protein R [Clostridium faecium]MDU1349615.1 stage II sporulation protein R [Clostridium argentinense]
MKKIFSILLVLSLSITIFSGYKLNAINQKEISDVSIEEISSKLIRFHVIANSDNENDQALKLKIRDKVLEYVSPKLNDSNSIEESRKILAMEDENILNIAREVINENGYSYDVESTLSKEYFPVKTYGNITLPQGKYEAYRIIIGSGEGQNWWCVMFPPLCFVDVTKGSIAYEETEKQMKEVLDEKEYDKVNNLSNDNQGVNLVDNSNDDNIVIKSKAFEMIKSVFK